MKENLIETPVLILGTGIGGLSAAIELANQGIPVTVVTKARRPEDCNTDKAQGGINGLGKGEDSPELLAKNTITAGAGRCGIKAVRMLSTEAQPGIEFLENQIGVVFDEKQTREGGHDSFRTYKVADETGKAIERALIAYAIKHPYIKILTDMMAVDLLTSHHHSTDFQAKYRPNHCDGAYLLDKRTGQVVRAIAQATILATGGAGQVYEITSNPSGATGDGLAMAHRAGVEMLNLEYVQFHPTTVDWPGANNLLFTEAARGEGGELVDENGNEFMEKYDPRKSRATRDIVARAINDMMVKTGNSHMYLKLKDYIPHDEILKDFPMLHATLKPLGIDITQDLIPVRPACHFMCGGVWSDAKTGQTNLENLYAAGEVAVNGGIHGANRLASNSLTAGLIWGRIAARSVAEQLKLRPSKIEANDVKPWEYRGTGEIDPVQIQTNLKSIRSLMWAYVGLVRTSENLAHARVDLGRIERTVENMYQQGPLNPDLVTLRNLAKVATLITEEAWKNKTSAGCHYRTS